MIIWSDTSVIRKGVGVEAHRVDHRVFTRGVHLPVEYAVLGSCRLRPGPEAGAPLRGREPLLRGRASWRQPLWEEVECQAERTFFKKIDLKVELR